MQAGQGGPQLADFEHKQDYSVPVRGRDRHLVRALQPWLFDRILELQQTFPRGSTFLDVGCGEQPLRKRIEERNFRYIGMDVVQNHHNSVSIIGPIDGPLADPWPDRQERYSAVICTEVLEHVADWHEAFGNLRRLLEDGGKLLLTIPFFFPLHMVPYDYFRATPHIIERFADRYGFEIERLDQLGDPLDVLCTVAEDLSITPEKPGIGAAFKARLLRMSRNLLLRIWSSEWCRSRVVIQSNAYLGNGAVLRAV
jgi:SAM-dependent methyltransferase